jgi:hypothetical protein
MPSYLTAKALAEKLNVAPRTIVQWAPGSADPSYPDRPEDPSFR